MRTIAKIVAALVAAFIVLVIASEVSMANKKSKASEARQVLADDEFKCKLAGADFDCIAAAYNKYNAKIDQIYLGK